MSQHQARVPAGVTTGGQFARDRRSTSTVTLAPDTAAGQPDEADGEVRRVVDQARSAARFASRRTGQDSDDIAGDAILAMVESNNRGRPWTAMSRGEINTIVPRIAYRKMSGLNSGEDFEGFRRFRAEVARIEQSENRVVGDAEADRIADRVRMSMPPKRRPKIGYHRPSRDRTDVRIDAQPTDGLLGVDVDYLSAADDSEDIEQSAFAYRLAEIEQIRHQEGRWAAMTVLRPAPLPQPNLLSEQQATELRRQVTRMGGARAVAMAWREGRASPQAAAAYFAAFGEIDDTGRDQVAETFMLAGTSENTDRVFSEVVSNATRRRPAGGR
ncbi:hypothetical protein [Nakamurella multipartita]|uniref:Uncharacterized protein n=1 Tax=Nakamurella multipartita (strain ATCC 700099 / DSM 44233 / CIP 104796 / JCM 9543 / NBRC 105858 / Y-104) TaxID=479431 RepID=C8X8N0_NAKMY|nr:hypothetical protein [Nakamurella multipartita]ACV79085.1 hypothetical protein Namu_2739 [Nakamurella multipartita DSM 44233]